MNSNNYDNINKIIKSDLNLDSDNSSDSDEKYDNLYSDPEEAFKFVNLLSQAYNDGNKDINSLTVQNLLENSNLNTINEEILNDNEKESLENRNNTLINNYNNNYNYNNYNNNNINNHNNNHGNSSSKSNTLNLDKPNSSNINENDSVETLKRKLQELQKSFDNLKEENVKLTNEKSIKEGEINVIRKRIKTIEQENDDLKKNFINKSKTIEEERQQERTNYRNEINCLQTQLQFKEQEIEELSRNHNTPIKTEIKKEHSDFPSLNDFPTQASFNHIPDRSSIYTNKSNYLKGAESVVQNDISDIPNDFNEMDIDINNSPEKYILDKVMTNDISVQTDNDDYSNQSRIILSKYQIPIPNSRFLFIQRLYNINIYSKLIKYIGATNKKPNSNSNTTQNVTYIIINKLLSSINDIIANSNIPISNLLSPLEEYIGLSLENNNLKMALTGLKLLLNIILNDNDSKNEILSYPMKDKVIENIHKHLSTMLNIVNQFNIKKNKGYQNLSFKFQKKFSNHLFTVLQLMVEECKNSEVLSLYRTYVNENLIMDFFNVHQKMDITLNIIQWLQYLIMDYEIEKIFQNKSILEAIALLLRHLNNNENKDNIKIQLNIIRLYSLIIAQESQSLRFIADSHIVISNIIYVLQTKLDFILEEKNTEENKNIMAIIKEGIKFIHAVFIKASNVFKILDTDESVNYIFIRLLSRLVVSKYYEDSWSYFIDDIYDIINDLLESILIGTPHENILKKLIPEEYETIEDKSINNDNTTNN